MGNNNVVNNNNNNNVGFCFYNKRIDLSSKKHVTIQKMSFGYQKWM